MANPTFVTQQNVKFNSVLDNAAVLDTTANVRSLVLWDSLSQDDKNILTNFINDNGGALPLVGPTSGAQVVDFRKQKKGADATGLSSVAASTAAVATVNIGGDKFAADASGLSSAQGTKGIQVVNFNDTIVAGTLTGLVPTSGYQAATFTVAKVGADATGLAVDTAGYQVVNVGGAKTGADTSGLTNDATAYTATITVDGVAKPISVVGSAAQTYTTLLAEINTDLGASAVAALVGGNIKVTSATTGAASSVSITAGTLFAAPLAGFVAVLAAVAGTHPVYTATITVDGVAKPISIDGNNAQTFTTLVSELNTDLGASAVAAVVSGGVKVTSATTTPTSTVAITAGTLFPALTNFSALAAAVAGTGSTAALTATIVVDGVTKNISILPAVIPTFADVINEINTDLGASAVASISGGDIKITSATFGLHSTIHITDITLFAALPSFAYVLPAQNGGGASRTYSATVVVDGTHIRPITFTGLAGDTIQHVLDEVNADLNIAAAAGYQDIKFGVNRVATSATGLANAATAYTATVTLDGGVRNISVLGSAAQTFTTLLSEIQTDLDAGGVIAVASIVNGKLRIASTTVSSASTVSIVDTGTYPLFASLTYFLEIAPAVIGNDLVTYATAAVTAIPGNIKITSATTGVASTVDIIDNGFLFNSLTGYAGISTVVGTAPKLYTATVVVDSGAGPLTKAISVQGSAAQTFTTLINEINTDLGADATASLTTAVAGYQDVLFSAVKVGGSATGLANNATAYTASVTLNGGVRAISVVGSAAQTFTNLLTEIQTDLDVGGVIGTVTINADGGLRIASTTTGIASSVVITAGTLFPALTNYSSLGLSVAGIGSDIQIISATTGLASKVVITDGTLFHAAGAKGIKNGVVGITNMLDAAKLQKVSGSESVFDHFNVIRVGLTPSSLWSNGHVPAKASIPKVPQFTYWDTTWKYIADDTDVNP